jgi:hypothetical protein
MSAASGYILSGIKIIDPIRDQSNNNLCTSSQKVQDVSDNNNESPQQLSSKKLRTDI